MDIENDTIVSDEQSASSTNQPEAYQTVMLPFRQRLSGTFREIVWSSLLVLLVYAFINMAIPRFVVSGHSMEPNLHTDEYVMVSRLHYLVGDPQRGDVVVFHLSDKTDLIKRVIGLPGEWVQMIEGQVYINGALLDEPYIQEFCRSSTCQEREWLLGKDEYFVLGDNRNNSHDSHDFGPIKRSQIVGKAWLSYWPPDDWGIFFP